MSSSNSTISPQQEKPQRPDDSPFFWPPNGGWCKKIRGQLRYFGKIGHDEVLAKFGRIKADLAVEETEPAQ